MLLPTKDVLEKIAKANFHRDFKVDVPKHISLAQLFRWLAYEFVPLPDNIELQLMHLPIFDPRTPTARYVQVRETYSIIKKYLKDGTLQAKGVANGRELIIPKIYWNLPYQNTEWNRSQTSAESTRSNGLFSNNKELIALSETYEQKYETLSYDNVNFACADVIHVFDGSELVKGYVLNLKKQFLERTLQEKKIGAKPRYDWTLYKAQFDELIAEYGLPGNDQPELKNQAAIERRLIEWGEEKFGIDRAPSSQSLRRNISKWLKQLTNKSCS